MRKYTNSFLFKIGLLCLLLLISLGFSGCAAVDPDIPKQRWISLTETENNQGNFDYGALTVKYSYSLTGSSLVSGGGNMILAGKVSYRGGFDSLDIRILFLDSGGAVLNQTFIFSSGYRERMDRISDLDIQKTFTVPAGSTAITFTYSIMERTGNRQ